MDPSIAGEFPDISDYRKFVQMVRKLGFSRVHEVAFGVDLVARAYKELFRKSKGKYYIMSNDPITVSYIEKYKIPLIPNLAPILSPVAVTASVIRHIEEEELSMVYITPLIASKNEILNFTGKAGLTWRSHLSNSGRCSMRPGFMKPTWNTAILMHLLGIRAPFSCGQRHHPGCRHR